MALEMKSPAESQSGRALRGRITKQWTLNSRAFRLDAEFQVGEGITILFGPSGAGKTTLLDCIAGVSVPDDGRITVGTKYFSTAAPARTWPSHGGASAMCFKTWRCFHT